MVVTLTTNARYVECQMVFYIDMSNFLSISLILLCFDMHF